MRKIFFDKNLQANFEKKGLSITPMLSQIEVDYLLGEVKKLRPNDNFAPSRNEIPDLTYHCSFLDTNVEYKRATLNLLKEVFNPHIKQHLIGYKILNCNFYVKPPGTGRFQIHQNWNAIANLNDTTVTVWCPLLDTNEENGTIQFVEGSHKLVPEISGPTVIPYFRNFETALIEKYLKPVSMKAGDAVIFDDSLLHWSDQNNSKEPRIAIQILCVPADTTPVFFYFDENNPSQFEMFEVDSEFFIENTITDLLTRPKKQKSLGFVENINQQLTEAEFVELLKNGDQIRQKIYSE